MILNPFLLFPPLGGGGFNPFVAPTAPSTGDATISVSGQSINTISPIAGDIILLTANGTSSKTVQNWTGTSSDPIILLCNGFRFTNGSITFNNCQFVIIYDLYSQNSTGNGIVFTRCRDCCFVNVTSTGASSNGIRVLGSTPYATANARLRFFNVTVNTWSGSDGLTFHIDGNTTVGNNINSHFIVVGVNIVAPVGADSGLDITTGKNFFVLDVVSDEQTNIGHGVENFYMKNHDGAHTIIKNTAGRVVCIDFTSPGTIDLSLQTGVHGVDNEGNPTEVVNPNTLAYCTDVLEYMSVGTINNNTSAQGTTTSLLSSDPLTDGDYAAILSAFVI